MTPSMISIVEQGVPIIEEQGSQNQGNDNALQNEDNALQNEDNALQNEDNAPQNEDNAPQNEDNNIDPDKEFAAVYQSHIKTKLDLIINKPLHTSSLFFLGVCKKLRNTLSSSVALAISLPLSLDFSYAVRDSQELATLIEQFESDKSILEVRSVEELIEKAEWQSWENNKKLPEHFLDFINKNKKTIGQLSKRSSLSSTVNKITIAYGQNRFSRAAKVSNVEEKLKVAVAKFVKQVLSTGIGAAPDIVGDLNNVLLQFLSASGTAKLRKEWGGVRTVLHKIPSLLPSSGVNNLIDSVLSSAIELEKQWQGFMKLKLQNFDILEKGQWVVAGFQKDISSILVLIDELEHSIVSEIGVSLSGSAGFSKSLSEAVLDTCNDLPYKTFTSLKVVNSLKKRAESASWVRLYHEQFSDLTSLIILFVFGLVLSIVLGMAVYRDVSNPLYILKNSLNNLAMGGEKRRINLKLGNEFGGLVEAYNRYLDSVTSVEKRMVRCPDCGDKYEIGDSYCRYCGRALRCT